MEYVISQKTTRVMKKLNILKLTEANNITKKNNNCYLIVTEGISAANFFEGLS